MKPTSVEVVASQDRLIARGAARIGRGGSLHPAIKWQRGQNVYVQFYCDCGGTSNGKAAHKATFYGATAATCKGKRRPTP